MREGKGDNSCRFHPLCCCRRPLAMRAALHRMTHAALPTKLLFLCFFFSLKLSCPACRSPHSLGLSCDRLGCAAACLAFFSNKTDDGDKTFQDRVLEEADRSKSLKIDHAALQRVMNVDGSLKHVDGESVERG